MTALSGSRFSVNCSTLFTEYDRDVRPSQAKRAGFEAVEYWWPFGPGLPSDRDVDRFIAAVRDAEVSLVCLNFAAGDLAGGDRGILSLPGKEHREEFRGSVEIAIEIGHQLGCRRFNALYGKRITGVLPEEQDKIAEENLLFAAQEASVLGASVVIEPLSGIVAYPLKSFSDAASAAEAIRGAGAPNVAVLADLYHLGVNGDDIVRVATGHVDEIAHFQVADHPGRHQPGTGTLPLWKALSGACNAGYDGWVGLEYLPSGRSEESFGWLNGATSDSPGPR
jgi:hydroxypyruvate isomerase